MELEELDVHVFFQVLLSNLVLFFSFFPLSRFHYCNTLLALKLLKCRSVCHAAEKEGAAEMQVEMQGGQSWALTLSVSAAHGLEPDSSPIST